MRHAATIAVLLFLGCASSTSNPAGPEPELLVTQMSNVAEVARHMAGNISVQYRLTIHNTTPTPLQLKRVDLQSIGEGAYALPSLSRTFDKTIDAGATEVIELWGNAFVGNSTISGANGPVTIRTIAQFESSTGRFQTVVMQQVNANGSI